MFNKVKKNSTIKAIGIIILLGLFIFGGDYLSSIQKKRIADKYYEALMKSDFDKAFNYLLLWDEYVDAPSKYSLKEAKDIYLKKMDSLIKEKDYKINEVNTEIVKRHDRFYVKADVSAQVNGQTIKYKDVLQFVGNSKLYIDYSEDVFSHLRDGKLEGWETVLK